MRADDANHAIFWGIFLHFIEFCITITPMKLIPRDTFALQANTMKWINLFNVYEWNLCAFMKNKRVLEVNTVKHEVFSFYRVLNSQEYATHHYEKNVPPHAHSSEWNTTYLLEYREDAKLNCRTFLTTKWGNSEVVPPLPWWVGTIENLGTSLFRNLIVW